LCFRQARQRLRPLRSGSKASDSISEQFTGAYFLLDRAAILAGEFHLALVGEGAAAFLGRGLEDIEHDGSRVLVGEVLELAVEVAKPDRLVRDRDRVQIGQERRRVSAKIVFRSSASAAPDLVVGL
jgi:hypothetical protein